MKKFLLRLPAQGLQSACLFIVAFCVLRIFGRVPFIFFDSRVVLCDLAFALAAAAVSCALNRKTGTVALLGMLITVSVFAYRYADDLTEQGVRIFLWASGGLSGQPLSLSDVTPLLLTAALFFTLILRLFTGFRGTTIILLAVYIAYVIAMPQAKIAIPTADALPGAAAILVLFFAARMEGEAASETKVQSVLKLSGKRTAGDSVVVGQKTRNVRTIETPASGTYLRVLGISCAVIALSFLLFIPMSVRLTKTHGTAVRETASDIEHRVRSAVESASGIASSTPVLDGQVGHQLNRYTGTEQFAAQVDVLPTEDLYLKGFTGGVYQDGVWEAADDRATFAAMAEALQITTRSDAWVWEQERSFDAEINDREEFKQRMAEARRPLSGDELAELFPQIFAAFNKVAATGIPDYFHAGEYLNGPSFDYVDERLAHYEVESPEYEEYAASDYLVMPFDGDVSQFDDVIVSTLYFYGGQVYTRSLSGKLTYISGGGGPIPELNNEYAYYSYVEPESYIQTSNLLISKAGEGVADEIKARTDALAILSPYLQTVTSNGLFVVQDTRILEIGAYIPREQTVGLDWSKMDTYGDVIAKALSMRDYYEKNGLAQYLSVPDSLPRLTEYVAQHPLSDETEITAFIRYTLDTHAGYSLLAGDPHDGTDPVEYFLFDSHRGYCEQYASAAVMMYRMYGIPARYATGYRVHPDEFSPVTDIGWQAAVPDRDAHAWVEIFLPTVGWTPVEMTVTSDRKAETLIFPGLTEGQLAEIRKAKGWVAGATPTETDDEDPDENNVNSSTAPQAAGRQTPAANTNTERQGLSNDTVRLVRTLILSVLCALVLLICLLMWRKNLRTRRPAKVGRAFERRFRKKNLRIESRDFADRAAAAFPSVSAEDFAAFRQIILSDAYGQAAGEEEAERVRALYRRACSK